MPQRDEIHQCIFAAIDHLNRRLPANEHLTKRHDTVLYGPDSSLDSLGLVHLVVATEGQIEQDFGRPIALADERALSQKHSPFRTVETMAQYIAALLNEQVG